MEGRLRGRAIHTPARVEEEAEKLREAPGLDGDDRAGGIRRAAADLDLAPAGLASYGQERPFGEELDPAGAVFALVTPTIEPDDLGTAQAAGKADRQDRPVAKAA